MYTIFIYLYMPLFIYLYIISMYILHIYIYYFDIVLFTRFFLHEAKMDGMAAIYYWGLKQSAEASAASGAPAAGWVDRATTQVEGGTCLVSHSVVQWKTT